MLVLLDWRKLQHYRTHVLSPYERSYGDFEAQVCMDTGHRFALDDLPNRTMWDWLREQMPACFWFVGEFEANWMTAVLVVFACPLDRAVFEHHWAKK